MAFLMEENQTPDSPPPSDKQEDSADVSLRKLFADGSPWDTAVVLFSVRKLLKYFQNPSWTPPPPLDARSDK